MIALVSLVVLLLLTAITLFKLVILNRLEQRLIKVEKEVEFLIQYIRNWK